MARSHSHFFRLNPAPPRTRKASIDTVGLTAFLLDVPSTLFWMTWMSTVVLGLQTPFRHLLSPTVTQRPLMYLINLGLPAAGLVFGLISFNQRRRKSDFGSLAIPLSLFLIAVSLLYGAIRVYSA